MDMRVTQVLTACAVLSLTACGQGSGSTGTTPGAAPPAAQSDRIDMARKYAPLVILGKDEQHKPIDATTFVDKSELRWNRDGACKDTEVDKDPTPQSLTDPNRYHQKKSSGAPSCDQSGRDYNTTEPTRPFDNAELGAQGYFLELRNEDDRKAGSASAPSYVQYVDGTDKNAGKTGYVYWFFYPWNQWTNPALGAGGNHEADWERVTVVVDKTTGPEAVVFTYHGHECRRNVTDVDMTDGRPTVYSAVGTHASYPVGDAKYQNKDLPPGLKDWDKLADSTSKTGEKWQIWGDLREAEREPWWGYAGGWGEVGGNFAVNGIDKAAEQDLQKRQTGPAGPSKHKNDQIRTEAFTDQPCQAPEGEQAKPSESGTPSATPAPEEPATGQKTKEGAIQRYQQALRALGKQDMATVCEIAAPAMKSANLPMTCPEAFQVTYSMLAPAKRQALQTVTVDPAKVRSKPSGEFEIPSTALQGSAKFAESDLGTQTMTYLNGNWFITDN
nr:Uncharacterized conserved protein of probably eukaryotic origin [Kibdelosporangium sp. MJ126-NF4]CTQ97118.1 Uncharacterized conserved protein of probably eukaryotic origin [Kibdelosporangium sp. MJ126-NF4]